MGGRNSVCSGRFFVPSCPGYNFKELLLIPLILPSFVQPPASLMALYFSPQIQYMAQLMFTGAIESSLSDILLVAIDDLP